MQEKVAISVIIPAYNCERTICECLDSVLSQKGVSLEVIVINDGSTDLTAARVRQYPEVKLINTPNRGSGPARNAGLDAATGEFVAFMDADDRYPSEAVLPMLYNAAVEHDANASGGSFILWENGKVIVNEFPKSLSGYTFHDEGMVSFADYQFDYGYQRFIFKREIIEQNALRFPDLRRYQDPPFMARLLHACGSFYAIPEPTYLYRSEPSKVHWDDVRTRDLIRGLNDELLFSKEHGYKKLHALVAQRIEEEFTQIITESVARGDPGIRRDVLTLCCSVSNEFIGRSETYIPHPLSDLLKSNAGEIAELYRYKNDYLAITRSAEYRLSQKLLVYPRKIKRFLHKFTADKSFKE